MEREPVPAPDPDPGNPPADSPQPPAAAYHCLAGALDALRYGHPTCQRNRQETAVAFLGPDDRRIIAVTDMVNCLRLEMLMRGCLLVDASQPPEDLPNGLSVEELGWGTGS